MIVTGTIVVIILDFATFFHFYPWITLGGGRALLTPSFYWGGSEG